MHLTGGIRSQGCLLLRHVSAQLAICHAFVLAVLFGAVRKSVRASITGVSMAADLHSQMCLRESVAWFIFEKAETPVIWCMPRELHVRYKWCRFGWNYIYGTDMVERVLQMVCTVKPQYNELLAIKNRMKGIIGHHRSV